MRKSTLALLLASTIVVPGAVEAIAVEFGLPAQISGNVNVERAGQVLFLGDQSLAAQLRSLSNARWTNYTLHYVVAGQETLIGQSQVKESWTEESGRAAADFSLGFGSDGRYSLYIEAEHIALYAANSTGEILPRHAEGHGYSYVAPENMNDFTYRTQFTPHDHKYYRQAKTNIVFHATGVRTVEWFNAIPGCSGGDCPPGGGSSEIGEAEGTTGVYVSQRKASFIRLESEGGTLTGGGQINIGIASGSSPVLVANGTWRLPGAKLAGGCEACLFSGNGTLNLSGQTRMENLSYGDNQEMLASLSGDVEQVRLDERQVDSALLGLDVRDGPAVLAAAAGLAALTKILLGLLFTRRKKDPLEHPRRQALFTYVVAHPGATFREVAREVGLAAGTARHHLTVLKRSGLVVEHPYRSSVRFFENHGKFAKNWRETVLLREPSLAILEEWIKAHPGAPQKDILDAMAEHHGWSRSTTQHRLSRIVAEGLAHAVPSGRLLHYRPGPKPVAGATVVVVARPSLAIPSRVQPAAGSSSA